MGALANSPPLGLITVAALLPKHWQFQILDLNTKEFSEELWLWADLICVGGMLPQQDGILQLIHKANHDKKFIVAGGPDPSSQPDLYQDADVLILGEGEITIPEWLALCEKNQQLTPGVFKTNQKPDVTQTPIPRFDLIDFNDYMQMTVQFSRGCPFNCEFCDIIELYGRVPRTKNPEQFLNELESLYQLGYRGWVDIVDDNFIGNKRKIKEMLRELETWSKKKNYPFFFSTEASMNLADDKNLLLLMQSVDFRYVFMGIETPDKEILLMTQKSQNTMKPIVQRVQQIYEYGITVFGGFIIGFDNEKTGTDQKIIQCIEESGIIIAMVGLLVALPNTQLTRRLMREKRLFNSDGKLILDHGSDQTSVGLNFVTTRDRYEILSEQAHIVDTIYHPRIFMNRVLRTIKKVKYKRKHFPGFWEWKRHLRGLWNISVTMTKNKHTRWLYWRNFFTCLFLGFGRLEVAMAMMGSYLHLEKQTSSNLIKKFSTL